MTLTEFLTARLDEDEAVARKVIAERDRIDWAPGQEPTADDFDIWADLDAQSPHVAVGAERVLREVEAKRAIVAAREALVEPDPIRAAALDFALGRLAAVYADHPDYRQEWKP